MVADVLTTLWQQFPLALFLTRLLVVPLSFTVHELAHGLTALALGDPTSREKGRLTANPLCHIEYIGLITGVLIGVGWSRRTPLQPHKSRLPDWLAGALSVLAGLLATLGVVLAGQAIFARTALSPSFPWSGWPALADFVTVAVRFNLSLALLNLLPLFPLDMYMLIRYLLPLKAADRWQRAAGWTTTILGVGVALLLLLPPVMLRTLLTAPMLWGFETLLGW